MTMQLAHITMMTTYNAWQANIVPHVRDLYYISSRAVNNFPSDEFASQSPLHVGQQNLLH